MSTAPAHLTTDEHSPSSSRHTAAVATERCRRTNEIVEAGPHPRAPNIRAAMTAETEYQYQAVLLDIEGTIAPVAFVYDTLFPFAHEHVARYVAEHFDDVDVQKDIEDLRHLAYDERAAGHTDVPEIPELVPPVTRGGVQKAVRECVHALMARDSKATALKSLQGKIWREGYERGQIVGELYDDAIRALARWDANGVKIGIYSSGSVEAQQLLIGHSNEGDLRPFVSHWFDTTTGPKRERKSYETIADEMELTPSDILFATDIVAEALAAKAAGLQVVIMERLGNEKQPPHPFPIEEDFEMV
ncbi:MAG: acireductone synthase [Proteobacteria bacterium]|nr:acireductone synthase [Pseudomonadota bacterium]